MPDEMVAPWRLYDVRGETAAVAEVGQQILRQAKGIGSSFLIGFDGSDDSREVAHALEHEVRDFERTFEIMTSPAVYRLSRGYSLAVMVTASHDAQEGRTGLKVAQDGNPWASDEYGAVRASGGLLRPTRPGSPGMGAGNEMYAYRRILTAGAGGFFYSWDTPIQILAGSEVAARLAEEVLTDLGLQVDAYVTAGLDPADPSEAHVELMHDYAVLIDADADRFGLCWRGHWYPPEAITQMDLFTLAGQTDPGRTKVLFDLRVDAGTLATARGLGFVCNFSPGGRWMNLATATPEYAYGAETSGHRYWQGFSGSDCAVYQAIKSLASFIVRDPQEPPPPVDIHERRGVSDDAMNDLQAMLQATNWTEYSLDEGYGGRYELTDQGWIAWRRDSNGGHAIAWQGRGEELLP